ncbi:LOW QUALITY PROTEIN: monocarboxylate transporter 12-like [Haliotis rubra]|uniref:LOW QUALITY PROTEIN: monocarboxylate transporter 12-like n=1 Tax=Haliotis rubra TaxID=36100 RepID=UPI001EE606D3|nr:LOW QUALITY PROTEIN: monocarboxylate transporter 12-like [Haliotis rubra]
MAKQSIYPAVVLFASFTTMLCGPSIVFASGVIHVALLERFQEDVTITAWVGSLFSCMFALTGPIASMVINVFDCRTCVVISGVLMMVGFSASCFVTEIRTLFVTYSLIAGLGTGLAQTGSFVIIGFYFPVKSGLVTGISISGIGLGIFIHPPLLQFLTETYGVHGAFLITGGITLHVCIAGMLMRPSDIERKRKHRVGKEQPAKRNMTSICRDETSVYHVISNVSFLFFLCSLVCFSIAIATEYLFLPDFFIKHGSTFQEGAFVISTSGLGSIVSRILIGFALNDEKIASATMYSSLNGIIAIFTFMLPLFNTSSFLRILYGFILGLYSGGIWVLLNTLTLEFLGIQDFATGVGAALFSCGVGYLTGPPIAGAIVEASGSYYSVFLLSGAMFFSATVLGFLSTLSKKTQPRTKDSHVKVTVPLNKCDTEVELLQPSKPMIEMKQTSSEYCDDKPSAAAAEAVLMPATESKENCGDDCTEVGNKSIGTNN